VVTPSPRPQPICVGEQAKLGAETTKASVEANEPAGAVGKSLVRYLEFQLKRALPLSWTHW